jgi:hypothetical protein
MLKQLNRLRQRFLSYFTEGQYRFLEGLAVEGGDARLYTLGNDTIVVAINASDAPAEVTVTVDPTVWGGASGTGTLTAVDLDGNELERTPGERAAFRRTVRLAPDSLQIYAFTKE